MLGRPITAAEKGNLMRLAALGLLAAICLGFAACAGQANTPTNEFDGQAADAPGQGSSSSGSGGSSSSGGGGNSSSGGGSGGSSSSGGASGGGVDAGRG
jgi:hypothetical protein